MEDVKELNSIAVLSRNGFKVSILVLMEDVKEPKNFEGFVIETEEFQSLF